MAMRDTDWEDPNEHSGLERRMMPKEDELVYRLKHGHPPKTILAKEAKMDNSRPAGERVYIDYYITNLEQDEK